MSPALRTAGKTWPVEAGYAPSNWQNNVLPDGPGAPATFGNAISTPQIVTLGQNISIGSLTFQSPVSYTISQGTVSAVLTLDNAGAAAAISVTAGNHTISALSRSPRQV